MIWTYLKIAYRNLKKNKFLTFIHLFGLAFAMSVGMMQMVILQNELDYDKFHPHPSRTYRVISEFRQKNGGHWRLASTPLPLSAALVSDTTAIASVVNVYPACNGTGKTGDKELPVRGTFTEASFFRVFGFTLAGGDPVTALQQPHTLVLSHKAAERFFGDANALGKTIDINGLGLFTVTGVMQPMPGKSHLDFDVYASAATIPVLERSRQLVGRSGDWGDLRAAYTYIVLKEGATPRGLEGVLRGEAQRFNNLDKNGHASFALQPLKDITPAKDDDLYNDIGGGTSWGKLYAGIWVSLIILIAACFNYTNLTIARALSRAKESGIRKIVGARRYQLFVQYLLESLVQTFLALAFAWLLLSLIVRYAPFNDGYEMIPSAWHYNLTYVLCTLGFAAFTGILAGTAPAWILSSFQPLRVLKNLSTARIFGKVSLQKTLIVFQYSLSLVIIIFLTSFFRQFSMLAVQDPGFKRDRVLVVPLEGIKPSIAGPAVAMVSGVQSVSPLSIPFKPHFAGGRIGAWTGPRPKEPMALNCVFTDESFLPSMGIRLLAGRDFGTRRDTLAEREIIVNARAVRGLGFSSFGEAIGKKLYLEDSSTVEIIGVTDDFKYENAGKPVDPLGFRQRPEVCQYLYITMKGVDKKAFAQRVTAALQPLGPGAALTSSWLDETLAQNNSQRATISLLGYLAFIALGIATLGLLGLVIYTVETRRKETGIRKIIGASNGQIVAILSKRFIRLIFISGVIAVPIGYTMNYLFLQNFVDRVGNGLISALGCFVFLLGVGLVTIFSQTWKAAQENPVNSLRTE